MSTVKGTCTEENEVFFEAHSDDEDVSFEDAVEIPAAPELPTGSGGLVSPLAESACAGVDDCGPSTPNIPEPPVSSGNSLHSGREHGSGRKATRDAAPMERKLAEAMTGLTLTSEEVSNSSSQAEADRKAVTVALARGYPLHRAVYDGNINSALELLRTRTEEERLEEDPQGNTNARRWTPLEEAISLRDKELVKLLHSREIADLKAEMKAKKGALVDSIRSMPNYSFQLKWELGSPVLGMLLRKYAPHDTYEVWKLGAKLRVDGSLMGLDDKRTRLLPQWKRGHFSLLFDGATTPATILLCDHVKKTYLDLSKEKKRHKPTLDEEATMIISEGAGKTKMRASEFRFKVAKTWLGSDSTERIEGWNTRIFEAAGKMVAVTTTRAPFKIPAGASFEEYLELDQAQDEVIEVPVDPYSIDTSPGKPPKESATASESGGFLSKKPPKAARRLTGKCWMAENFPMSLNQLLPILAIIGNANKHIARVGKFLQKYGDMSLFPVKLQVPLIYTVYALISFRQFKLLADDPNEAAKSEDFYSLPQGYRMKTFEDIAAKKSRRSASWDVSEGAMEEAEANDSQILSYMGL